MFVLIVFQMEYAYYLIYVQYTYLFFHIYHQGHIQKSTWRGGGRQNYCWPSEKIIYNITELPKILKELPI